MAEAAKPNTIDGDNLNAMIERMAGLEQEKIDTMMEAVSACKPFVEQQREIRNEAKEQGIRVKVFQAAWAAKKAMISAEKKVAGFEDDDREQMIRVAEAVGGPLGDWLTSSLNEPSFS
jgi:uncharacterized protein (UPF0335 family)